MAVDIWGLGQIAYQLLCCPSQQQILEIPEEMKAAQLSGEKQLEYLLFEAGNKKWLDGNISPKMRTLIANMVLDDPANRPEIEDVIQHPIFQNSETT